MYQQLVNNAFQWENSAFVISKKHAQKWDGTQKPIHVSNKLFALLLYHQTAKCASVHIPTALESTLSCARKNLAGLKKEISVQKKSFVLLLSLAIVKVANDLAQIAFDLTRKLVSKNLNGTKRTIHVQLLTLSNP